MPLSTLPLPCYLRWNWGCHVNATGSAIVGFGVVSDPEGATVPLFPANQDDGSKDVNMLVISGDGHQDDGLAAVDAKERLSAWLVGRLGDRSMMLRGVTIRGSLGTLTFDLFAATNWLWCLTTLLPYYFAVPPLHVPSPLMR